MKNNFKEFKKKPAGIFVLLMFVSALALLAITGLAGARNPHEGVEIGPKQAPEETAKPAAPSQAPETKAPAAAPVPAETPSASETTSPPPPPPAPPDSAEPPATLTAQKCEDMISAWSDANQKLVEDMNAKYPDLEAIGDKLMGGDLKAIAGLRDQLTASVSETVKAAGIDPWCANLLVEDTLDLLIETGVEKADYVAKCEPGLQKINDWAQNNNEKSEQLRQKYAEIENQMNAAMGGDPDAFIRLRAPLALGLKELLTVSEAEPACAEILAWSIVQDMKQMQAQMGQQPPGEELNSWSEESLGPCAAEMKKVDKWAADNPEKANALIKNHPEIDQLMNEAMSGSDEALEKLKAPMLAALTEVLAAAGADVSCAQAVADKFVNGVAAMREIMNQQQEMAPESSTAETADDYSFETLCGKYYDSGMEIGLDQAEMENLKATCFKVGDEFAKDNANGQIAIETFVKTIMDACEDLTSQEWIECYAKETEAALEAARKVMEP